MLAMSGVWKYEGARRERRVRWFLPHAGKARLLLKPNPALRSVFRGIRLGRSPVFSFGGDFANTLEEVHVGGGFGTRGPGFTSPESSGLGGSGPLGEEQPDCRPSANNATIMNDIILILNFLNWRFRRCEGQTRPLIVQTGLPGGTQSRVTTSPASRVERARMSPFWP